MMREVAMTGLSIALAEEIKDPNFSWAVNRNYQSNPPRYGFW